MSAGAPRFAPRRLAPEGTPAGDLLARRGPATALFPEPPESADALLAAAGPDVARLEAGAFRTSGPAAREKLERILAGEGVLVSTGQQPNLFLGPLYVLYKALGARSLARSIEERYGVPALASFWVASDDHDWDEVGQARILDVTGEVRGVRLDPPPERSGRSVGRTALPEGMPGLLAEFFQYIPDTEFKHSYLELLQAAYEPGRSAGEAFAAALSELAGEEPIAWLDSASPAVRMAASPLFERVVRERAAVAVALAEGEAAVREAGYEPQLHRRAGGIPLFVDLPSGRTRLLAGEAGGVRAGKTGEEKTEADVLSGITAEPERFSPNVALRPVLESWLLPVCATVLGPSEVAYWAELPALFRWAEVPLPAVYARPSWSLVESKVDKVLVKIGAEPESFSDGGRSLAERITEEGLPEGVRSAMSGARQRLVEAFSGVENAVEGELPGVRSSVGVARHSAFRALDELERAIHDRVRERQQILLDQIDKAGRNLYPDGQPQERVVSPFYYLARYGPGFLDAASRAAGLWARGALRDVAAPEEAG